MRLDEFDYDLPEELIALRPARPRDSARLLVAEPTGGLFDAVVRDLTQALTPGDLMVFNDTRTLAAALRAVRPARDQAGATVNVSLNLIAREGGSGWRALAKPGKRLKPGDRLVFAGGLEAEITDKGADGEIVLAFDRSGAALDAALFSVGEMPLPPYIASRRGVDAADAADYQTVYAARDGSAATPTAGLHFTDRLLAALEARGIERVFVTLHVGAGTFLPVKSETVEGHRLHAEWREVSPAAAAAINRAKAEGRRIVAVGTTSVRTLESSVDAAGRVVPGAGETEIFIMPGFRFRVVDRMLTNFHLPRSTLLMLVAAFAGMEVMKRAYAHAVRERYRFYSYGDACLFTRADPSDG
jgi:S-adenosylmethionine:tRNA ribosyltransferase-isomerase